jgi:hypothetical protein
VLAHAHLRLGSLALARVELETMAGMGRLDIEGLIDLAEVRWRTGDLLGAGEAASAALRDDEGPAVVLVIAAEAAAALGRPTEARRLAALALARADGSIDRIFAGMPRSGVWPGDAAEPPPTAPTLFDRDPEPVTHADVRGSTGHARPATEPAAPVVPVAPVALGFWDAEPGMEAARAPMPDAGAELDAGRAALVAGSVDEAAFRFSLALRTAPALAPAVLEATTGARGTTLLVVRGDAYRLAGHEEEARQAYAIAAQGGLPERRRRPRPRQKTRVGAAVDAGPSDDLLPAEQAPVDVETTSELVGVPAEGHPSTEQPPAGQETPTTDGAVAPAEEHASTEQPPAVEEATTVDEHSAQ